jgi:hypothetical protein
VIGYALLLDSGATWRLKSAKTRDAARDALAKHNEAHRIGKAERDRCMAAGDYMNAPLVLPRLAVGLICPKPKNAGAVKMGQAGGKARAAKLEPKRRREIAQKAARARWASKAEGVGG